MKESLQRRILPLSARVALISFVSHSFIITANAQQQEIFPSIIEKAPIGMEWADFIAANPGAVIMDFGPDSIPDTKPDPKKLGEGLVIKLSNSEGLILFNFVDGNLEAVVLSRKSEGDYAR